jgi:pimeloyl-ACP methyl ester carboxylesterase
MGYSGLVDTSMRAGHFRHILTNLGRFERGSPEWLAEAFLKTTGGDPEALLRVLDSFVDTTPDQLAGITQPTLVLSGDEDDDNGSGEKLAETLRDARYEPVQGGHMSAVVKPELGEAIAAFLAA